MKLKLVRRRVEQSYPIYEVYDIYVGIRPIYFPFKIKWYADAIGLSEHEAKERVWNSYLSVKGTKLETSVE